MTCAKFRCYWSSIFKTRALLILVEFSNSIEISLVGWAPGQDLSFQVPWMSTFCEERLYHLMLSACLNGFMYVSLIIWKHLKSHSIFNPHNNYEMVIIYIKLWQQAEMEIKRTESSLFAVLNRICHRERVLADNVFSDAEYSQVEEYVYSIKCFANLSSVFFRIFDEFCFIVSAMVIPFNTLRPRQNGRLFADDTFKCILLNENIWTSIHISLKFVPKGPINNI